MGCPWGAPIFSTTYNERLPEEDAKIMAKHYTADEALREQPALILMDIQLPKIEWA
ncbi:hypothetical protein ES703_26685 [subsurface metagenome]